MLTLRLETGWSLGPLWGHRLQLALPPVASWHNVGGGVQEGAPVGKPQKDIPVGLGLEPSSPMAVFLKLVSLPGEVCILGELSTEHPSPRQQGEGGGGGRGVHLLQKGRSLCLGIFGHVGSPAEWQEGELGIPTALTLNAASTLYQ